MAETILYSPENQANTVPAWFAMNNGGFGGLNGGLGGGIVGFLLGLAFGSGNGFGGFGGNNNNNANANAQREMLNNAILSQGEASRAAVQNLSAMLGQDFNLVNGGVQVIQSALSSLAVQQAVSVPTLVNAIQSGDSNLMSKLCDCCCENRLLTTQQGYENRIQTIDQTNTLNGSILGSGQRTVDAIADLKTTVISEFCAARERDMQSKIDTQADIITQLRGQLDNDRQTAQFTALLAPIQQQVNTIASKQVNTVPVQWPNLTAVNTTPYVSGGFYGNGWGFGNGFGFGNGINF